MTAKKSVTGEEVYEVDVTLQCYGTTMARTVAQAEDIMVSEISEATPAHAIKGTPHDRQLDIEAVAKLPDVPPEGESSSVPGVYPDGGRVEEVWKNAVRMINAFEERYPVTINEMAMGEPQYDILRGWCRGHDERPKTVAELLGLERVIPVPGPMLHPVVEIMELKDYYHD